MDVAIQVVDLSQTGIDNPTGTNDVGADPTLFVLGLCVSSLGGLIVESGVVDEVRHIVAHLV